MPDPQKNEDSVDKLYAVWPRLAILLSVMAGAFTYVVSEWAMIEPVLSSPAMVLISMLTIYGLGGLSAYWLVARPLEYRLGKAEGVINRMRDRERELGDQITTLMVEVAKLQTRLDLISPPMLATPSHRDGAN